MPTRSEMATRGAETRARIIELGGLALGLTLAYLTQRAGLWDISHLMQLKDALVLAATLGLPAAGSLYVGNNIVNKGSELAKQLQEDHWANTSTEAELARVGSGVRLRTLVSRAKGQGEPVDSVTMSEVAPTRWPGVGRSGD